MNSTRARQVHLRCQAGAVVDALGWFDAAVLREKAARKAVGRSEELSADEYRILRECAERNVNCRLEDL